MKRLLILVCVAVSGWLSTLAIAQSANPSPVGIWKTIDDVTGKPKALVQLWVTREHILYGKIVKVFPRPGLEPNPVCKACAGKKHNQPLKGLVFLEGLRKSNNSEIEWSGGKILDPKNGKEYKCTLQVVSGGQKLNVRGYLGLPLFGRTQTWLREGNTRH